MFRARYGGKQIQMDAPITEKKKSSLRLIEPDCLASGFWPAGWLLPAAAGWTVAVWPAGLGQAAEEKSKPRSRRGFLSIAPEVRRGTISWIFFCIYGGNAN